MRKFGVNLVFTRMKLVRNPDLSAGLRPRFRFEAPWRPGTPAAVALFPGTG
jgi:hypothetical protein